MSIFTNKGIMKGLLVDWSQITGIPDRILELAALGDPGARRFIVWNDTTNDLEYLELLADDVPYDNAVSGLTATNVQEAIDEIYAAITASGVFAGYVDESVAAEVLPAGWTVSKPAAGRFLITHSLGLASIYDLAVSPGGINAGQTTSYMPTVIPIDGNSFEINLWNVETGSTGGGGGPVNGLGFFFTAKLVV
jgi:hypothetical protein